MPTQQDLEAAIARGDGQTAAQIASQIGADVAESFRRAWNVAAGHGDSPLMHTIAQRKEIEAQNAAKAVAHCLAQHAGKRDCDDFLREHWYHADVTGNQVHDRDLGWAVLAVAAEGCLTPDEEVVGIRMAWSHPEFPEANADARAWRAAFERIGYTSDEALYVDDDEDQVDDEDLDADEADLLRVPRPAEPMRLYRGALAARRRGLAWTADPERAAWFARRFNGTPGMHTAHVWTVLCPPERLLARIVGRHEDEYVADVRGLTIEKHQDAATLDANR